MSSTELYLRLLRYVAPYRGVFAVAILGTIVVALTEPVLPAIMKPLFDGAFVERDPTVIRWIPVALIALMRNHTPSCSCAVASTPTCIVCNLRTAN